MTDLPTHAAISTKRDRGEPLTALERFIFTNHCTDDEDLNREFRGMLTAVIAEIGEDLRRWHKNGRASIEFDGDTVSICRGHHEKYEPCQWVRYREVRDGNT